MPIDGHIGAEWRESIDIAPWAECMGSAHFVAYRYRHIRIWAMVQRKNLRGRKRSLAFFASGSVLRSRSFKGKIYAAASDLSPDGSLFIYLAMKAGWDGWDENRQTSGGLKYLGAWTAISRPPFYTAFALWPRKTQRAGGGLFLNDTTIWLEYEPAQIRPEIGNVPNMLTILADEYINGDFQTWSAKRQEIYEKRFPNTGWKTIQQGTYERVVHRKPFGMEVIAKTHTIVAKKPSDAHHSILERYLGRSGSSLAWDTEYTIRDRASGSEILLHRATWADFDQQSRIVFAKDGCLWSVDDTDARHISLIADFNNQKPEPILSPDWARHWKLPSSQ